jgi:Fe-S cluster assembly iron-binding protein IscA
MLAVTDNAATAIRDITSQEAVPPGAGLRIAADDSGGSLTLSLVAEPYEGDQVSTPAGARLFLDAEAALLLDDKELDVAVDPVETCSSRWPTRAGSERRVLSRKRTGQPAGTPIGVPARFRVTASAYTGSVGGV